MDYERYSENSRSSASDMTKRELIAMHIMAGMMSNVDWKTSLIYPNLASIAAVHAADMLLTSLDDVKFDTYEEDPNFK